MEESFYDVIDEADMLDNQQMQMSSDYLDVINDPNIKDSSESKGFGNHNNPFISSISTAQSKRQTDNVKEDCCSWKSGNSTSSSDVCNQEITQDYLNPYQPMIKISPSTNGEYLVLATVHTVTDSSLLDYKADAKDQQDCKQKHHQEVEKEVLPQSYKRPIRSVECIEPTYLSKISQGKSNSCENLNVKRIKMNEKDGENTNTIRDDRLNYCRKFKTKSESDIYSKHALK